MDWTSATLRDSGLLERQDVEYVSFLREEEIYNWSSLSLFIPKDATTDHTKNLSAESRANPRSVILQGELLLCYAIFTPEPELIKRFSPVLSMKDDEEAKETKKDPLKRLAAIVKHSAFFQNIRFEISFLSIANLSVSADLSRKIITETDPSHVPQLDPSESWNVLAKQNNHSNAPLAEDSLPFIILGSGEIVFPLQFPIAITKSSEDTDIKLRIVVTPVSFPDQQKRRLDDILSYLLNENALQRFPHQRTANQIVKVQQPLHVFWKHINMNNTDYVNMFVENQSKMDVYLNELNIYANTTKIEPQFHGDDAPEDVQSWGMANHFAFSHQHGQLPITLSPGDQYAFVVKAKPNFKVITSEGYRIPAALMDRDVSAWNVETKLKILWSAPDITTPVVSYIPIKWISPKHEELLVSISTQAPAPLNALFDVGFTITNLSSIPRTLQLHLNPLWMRKEKSKRKQKKRAEDSQSNYLLCLEKSANIGELGGYSSTSLNLPFLAIDEGIFQIDKVQIVDKKSGEVSFLADRCEIHVQHDSPN